MVHALVLALLLLSIVLALGLLALLAANPRSAADQAIDDEDQRAAAPASSAPVRSRQALPK